jgi:hypothetical protein
MTEQIIAVEVNCETGEETIRALTTQELAQREADASADAQRKAQEQIEIEAKAELKASALAKLAALGLTEDEAKAIAG